MLGEAYAFESFQAPSLADRRMLIRRAAIDQSIPTTRR